MTPTINSTISSGNFCSATFFRTNSRLGSHTMSRTRTTIHAPSRRTSNGCSTPLEARAAASASTTCRHRAFQAPRAPSSACTRASPHRSPRRCRAGELTTARVSLYFRPHAHTNDTSVLYMWSPNASQMSHPMLQKYRQARLQTQAIEDDTNYRFTLYDKLKDARQELEREKSKLARKAARHKTFPNYQLILQHKSRN